MSTPFHPVDPASLGITDPHVDIDTTVAHPARVYDYVLGGKDNYPADREVGDKIITALPTIHDEAVGNREFLRRTVRHVVGEEGIDQILDIGTGIPTVGPTHQVADETDPSARVVYVDNDPIVLAHARALLVDDNRTTIIQADVRDPDTILAKAREHLDLSRPVALMFVGLWYFISDDDDIEGLLAQYRNALAPGSAMIITHALDTPGARAVQEQYKASAPLILRSEERITEFFAGWDIIEPGIVPVHEWRPDGGETPAGHMAGGVGILPTA